MRRLVLRKGYGSWSAGTEVEINWDGDDVPEGMVEVRVMVANRPIIDVRKEDIVERRLRTIYNAEEEV